jgi:hypothetical protein
VPCRRLPLSSVANGRRKLRPATTESRSIPFCLALGGQVGGLTLHPRRHPNSGSSSSRMPAERRGIPSCSDSPHQHPWKEEEALCQGCDAVRPPLGSARVRLDLL